MSNAKYISHEKVKEVFNYNPDTGTLEWRKFNKSRKLVVGTIGVRGYRIVNYKDPDIENGKPKLYAVHRLVYIWHFGDISEDLKIDHIDQNKLNNLIENLRLVTDEENSKNKLMSSRNTSGYTGIYWDSSRNKWAAEIKDNNKKIYLGRFVKIEDAVEARRSAEIKYNYHPNHGKIKAKSKVKS